MLSQQRIGFTLKNQAAFENASDHIDFQEMHSRHEQSVHAKCVQCQSELNTINEVQLGMCSE